MFSRPILIGLLCCLILSGPVRAQVSPSPISSTAEAVKSFDPVEATKAWLNTVPADKRAKSDAYFEGGYWLILWNFLPALPLRFFYWHRNGRRGCAISQSARRIPNSFKWRYMQLATFLSWQC